MKQLVCPMKHIQCITTIEQKLETFLELTVCVDSVTAGCDIRGQGEVGQPQVFDVNVAKCIPYGLVELSSGKHRCYRIGQV